MGTRTLFNLGVGRAGNLPRWLNMGLTQVQGIDVSKANLSDPNAKVEAYARVL